MSRSKNLDINKLKVINSKRMCVLCEVTIRKAASFLSYLKSLGIISVMERGGKKNKKKVYWIENMEELKKYIKKYKQGKLPMMDSSPHC